MKTISAGDANRHFSSLLREAARGEIITVLSRGKAVATIGPARLASAEREAAKLALLHRLRQQQPNQALMHRRVPPRQQAPRDDGVLRTFLGCI